MQSMRRMCMCRHKFLKLRNATLRFQAATRGLLARRRAAELRQLRTASLHIRAAMRAWADRQKYLRILRAVATLQMGLRRWQVSLCRLHHSYSQGSRKVMVVFALTGR